jgi:nitrite reductase (NADH) small subunit
MNWLNICALDEINPLGSRIVAGPKGDMRSSAPLTRSASMLPAQGGPLSQG